LDNFRAAASLDADGARAARACLDNLGIAADSVSTRMRFGIVYATERLADELPSILSILRDGSPDTQWYGTVGSGIIALTSAGTSTAASATTATEGVEAVEVHDQPGLAILVGEADPDNVCGFSTNKDDLGDFSAVHGAWLNTHYPGIVLVHGDPLSQGTEELISELAERTGAFLIGGLSAMPGLGRDADTEDEEHEITGVQIAKTLSNASISGLMLAGSMEIATGLSQGCSPIGPTRTVTEGTDNIVAELDGRPALDPFIEDIGPELAADLQQVAGKIFAAKPVGDGDTGDYLVRNLMAIDPNRGWIAIGDTVEEGEKILFCRRDRDAAEADLRRMLSDLKKRSGKPPKAGFYHSCIARGPHLFSAPHREVDLIREELGDFPLIGFFGNGEISNNRLYGYTGVLTLFL